MAQRDYNESKKANTLLVRKKRESANDISEDIKAEKPNIRRRNKALKSLRYFCETYFKEFFSIAWASFHLSLIDDLELCIKKGGSKAIALPRGSGKSTVLTVASIWAILAGYRFFGVICAVNQRRANALVDDIKTIFATNDKLRQDFPEVCIPFIRAENSARTAQALNYEGVDCRFTMKSGEIHFALVPGSRCSEAVLMAAGLDGGNIRGLSKTTSKGERRRPDFVLIDDPQTRETAESESQTEKRLTVLFGDIMGMAGAGKKLSVFITETIIRKGDFADKTLDRKVAPFLRGEKHSLLVKMPNRLDLWDEYNRIRRASFYSGGLGEEATEYYKENMAQMQEGADVSWQARHNEDELDGLQFAMNLYYTDKEAFFAEYQNEPETHKSYQLQYGQGACKASCNGRKRLEIPAWADRIVGHVDVHKNLLYYTLVATNDQTDCALIDYGAYPKQLRDMFTQADATVNIQSTHKGLSFNDALRASILELFDILFTRQYRTDDGNVIEIERLFIDANWGETTDAVYRAVYDSKHRSRIYPSHGVYVGAKGKPFGYGTTYPGDILGDHMRVPKKTQHYGLKYVLVDSNYWKTQLFNKLTSERGTKGRLEIFGDASEHQLLIKHLCAEYAQEVEAGERRVTEWKSRSGGGDNHYLDNLANSCAAAALCSNDPAIRNASANDNARQLSSFVSAWQKKRASQNYMR